MFQVHLKAPDAGSDACELTPTLPQLQVITSNIFNSQCQVLVNTVNCVGAMGAGIALECRLRYPAPYREYVGLCAQQRIAVGQLWLFESPQKWVLNLPTKKDWRNPSEEQYLQAELKRFLATYKAECIAHSLGGQWPHALGFERTDSQQGAVWYIDLQRQAHFREQLEDQA